MPDLAARFAGLILAFAPLFVYRSWRPAQPLLIGAILTPGRRTVTSVLRILGHAQERRFVNVHRIFTLIHELSGGTLISATTVLRLELQRIDDLVDDAGSHSLHAYAATSGARSSPHENVPPLVLRASIRLRHGSA